MYLHYPLRGGRRYIHQAGILLGLLECNKQAVLVRYAHCFAHPGIYPSLMISTATDNHCQRLFPSPTNGDAKFYQYLLLVHSTSLLDLYEEATSVQARSIQFPDSSFAAGYSLVQRRRALSGILILLSERLIRFMDIVKTRDISYIMVLEMQHYKLATRSSLYPVRNLIKILRIAG